MIANEAEPALGMEMMAVEADDARRLLAAMLEGVQPKGGECRGIGMVKDAENAAFLVQPVLFEPAQRAYPLGQEALPRAFSPS